VSLTHHSHSLFFFLIGGDTLTHTAGPADHSITYRGVRIGTFTANRGLTLALYPSPGCTFAAAEPLSRPYDNNVTAQHRSYSSGPLLFTTCDISLVGPLIVIRGYIKHTIAHAHTPGLGTT